MAILPKTYAITLTLFCCMAQASDTTYGSPFDGVWQTKIQIIGDSWESHGTMTFINKERAEYEVRNGRIIFTEVNDQGKWKGRWVEDNQIYVICPIEFDGSRAWGEAIFEFDPSYNKFVGTWDSCANGDRNPWVGHRE